MNRLWTLVLAAWPVCCAAAFIPENQRQIPTITIHVAPVGNDAGDGSEARPFQSLTRAQRAVRSANSNADVIVELADGVYRLSEPLQFRAVDGGQAGTRVIWKAAADASPVIAGSVRITTWKLYDNERHIYVADIPKGVDSRQVWVRSRLAKLASIEVARDSVAFDAEGMTINDPRYDYLATLPAQHRIEVQSTGWFTNRISPVNKIVGRKLLMQQPAWDNNTWGYDALNAPVGAETAHLYLNNALAFLRQPRQFYIDPDGGKLYVRPDDDTAIGQLEVELPRLQYLLAIGGTYERPLRDLAFQGIRFSYTSWLGPSSNDGYADQQSGAFLKGPSAARPHNAHLSCVWGCIEFETRRNDWSQKCRRPCRSQQPNASYSIRMSSRIWVRSHWVSATTRTRTPPVWGLARVQLKSNAACSPTWQAAPSWRAASIGTRTIRPIRRWQTAMSSSPTTGSGR